MAIGLIHKCVFQTSISSYILDIKENKSMRKADQPTFMSVVGIEIRALFGIYRAFWNITSDKLILVETVSKIDFGEVFTQKVRENLKTLLF